jgi:hypothetical protein
MFKINDADRGRADWRPYFRVYKDDWGRVFPPDDGCNAIAARPLDG